MTTFASTLALAAALSVGSVGAFAQTATKPAGCGPQMAQNLTGNGQNAHKQLAQNLTGNGQSAKKQLASGDGSGADVRSNRQLASGDGSGADIRANRQLASASGPCN
jgi:hypothetical protein